MRIVSRVLEGIVALVFVFGLLESLLTGRGPGARGLARVEWRVAGGGRGAGGVGRRASSGQSSEAWIGGYAGAMGWDGQVLPAKSETDVPSRGRRPARLTRARRQTIRARRVLASAA